MSTTTLNPLAQFDLTGLDEICRRHHVRKLSVFGSAVRGELRSDSDVDVLVEYEPGYSPSFMDLGSLDDDLSPLFNGRQMDVVLTRNLHWVIRDAVLDEAKVIYER